MRNFFSVLRSLMLALVWSRLKSFFSISDSSAAHGIVVRKLRLSFYLTPYLTFKDPYINTEYRIVSVSERSRNLRFCASSGVFLASYFLIMLLTSANHDINPITSRAVVFSFDLIWSIAAVIISFFTYLLKFYFFS